VVLVVGAMTDRDAETHRHSVEKTFPRMGETTTTENVVRMMVDSPLLPTNDKNYPHAPISR